MSSPLRMLFIAILAAREMERQRKSLNTADLGGKVKMELAGAGEHQEGAETLSCYSGDTPREEQDIETCETEVRSDGMNMEEQKVKPQRLNKTQVCQREGGMKKEIICVPASGDRQTLTLRQDGKDRRMVGVENSKVSFSLSGYCHMATHRGRGWSQRWSNGPSESSALTERSTWESGLVTQSRRGKKR